MFISLGNNFGINFYQFFINILTHCQVPILVFYMFWIIQKSIMELKKYWKILENNFHGEASGGLRTHHWLLWNLCYVYLNKCLVSKLIFIKMSFSYLVMPFIKLVNIQEFSLVLFSLWDIQVYLRMQFFLGIRLEATRGQNGKEVW